MLDKVENDNGDCIENFLNDSDEEFVIEESVVDRSNIAVSDQKQSVLVPETSIYIASDDAFVRLIR